MRGISRECKRCAGKNVMQLGSKGKALIQSFEKLTLCSYRDQGGVLTNGWGHTGADVTENQVVTPEQADVWFLQDTQTAVQAVWRSLDVAVTQNQFDALVSFTFNVGAGSEAHSTLVKLLNAGNTAGAADQFLVWDHVNGVENAGLKRRRMAERALFLAQ